MAVTKFGTAFVTAIASSVALATFASAAQAPKADLVNRKQLRICADPSDLPFSNEKGEGFENKIGEIIADELQLPVENTWYPKSMGFVRRTLFAKRCDVVIGWGQGDELVLNTNHIYRSVYALVVKEDSDLKDVEQLSDERLKDKRVGVIAGTPPGDHLARHGLMGKARPYSLTVDRRVDAPGAMMIEDLMSGEIDAGVLWGPLAAYWGGQDNKPVKIIPLLKEEGSPRLHYRITLGVRQGDDNWKRELNQIIAKRQGDIDKVLLDYGVPLLVDSDLSMEMITTPRPNGGVAVEDDAADAAAAVPRKASVPVPGSAAGAN
jgi:quinoprotein dehydrogenase-associated probable ABC transporter substrate-binding protein